MRSLGHWKGVILLALVYLAIAVVDPERVAGITSIGLNYSVEMALIIPAVVVLMGLFEVWVPKDVIQRYMGARARGRGALLAFLLGTAPTGPLYVAFPVAAGLLKKGASRANVIIFLGAWATAKIPQMAVEAKFLGLDFAITRLLFTGLSLIAMGHLGEFLLKKRPAHEQVRINSGESNDS